MEGGHHAIGQAARGRSRGQRAALEGRAQTCWTWTWTWTWVGEFWWFEKRSAQSVVARNAMPPPGDTDGAGGSEEAGEAPHAVVVLPATSEAVERDQSHSNLSSTLRPLVERERSERGDEDGAVGVVGGGLVASSTTRRRRMSETSESRDGDSRAEADVLTVRKSVQVGAAAPEHGAAGAC